MFDSYSFESIYQIKTKEQVWKTYGNGYHFMNLRENPPMATFPLHLAGGEVVKTRSPKLIT